LAAAKCPAIIKLCAVRVSLLDDDGTPEGTYYVSDKTVSLGFTPVLSTGQEREVRNGCDCVVATDKAPDVLLRFTFEIAQGVLEPGLLAMLLGQTPILDPDTPASVIGINMICDELCGKPYVALEAWAQAYDVDHPDPDFPWLHLRWPSTQWQLAPNTLSADFLSPALTGFSRGNSNFGDPFDDLPLDGTTPIAADCFAMWLQAEDPPTGVCGVQDIS